MNKQNLFSQFEKKIQDLLNLANTHRFFLGVKFPNVVVKEMKSYRNLGKAGKKDGVWTIWVNMKAIESLGVEHYSKSTLPHEVAHIACMFTNIDKGHGAHWKIVARHLGDDGERCASWSESKAFRAACSDMKKKPRYRYIYTRKDGREVKFTAQNHEKLQKNPSLLDLNKLNPWSGKRVDINTI